MQVKRQHCRQMSSLPFLSDSNMKQRYWVNTSTKHKTRRRPDKPAGLIYHAPLIDNPALQQATGGKDEPNFVLCRNN